MTTDATPHQDRIVAICGATGGIGEALVDVYAAPGTELLLAGRRTEALARLKFAAEAKGAVVRTAAFDLRDRVALEAWCEEAARCGTDILILGAGVSASVEGRRIGEVGKDGNGGEAVEAKVEGEKGRNAGEDLLWLPERNDDLLRELDVNATGNILAANAFVRALLLARAEGAVPVKHVQVAFVASLAALTGLPGSPGYSASKAALRTYGEALRRLLRGKDVGVTVLLPGYVESDMSRRYQGSKPWLMSAEKAARLMKHAIDAGKREYAFPKILAIGIALLKLVPASLEHLFLNGFFFTVEPDRESRKESGTESCSKKVAEGQQEKKASARSRGNSSETKNDVDRGASR